MKQYRPLTLLLLAVLLSISLQQARALWVLVAVTRNGQNGDRSFSIRVRDDNQFKLFTIEIRPDKRALSPFMTAELSLVANDAWVARLPLSESRENGVVTYTFRVTPSTLQQSSLEISEGLYAPTTGRSNSIFRTAPLGKQRVEQIMGGMMYRLALKDFATPAGTGNDPPKP